MPSQGVSGESRLSLLPLDKEMLRSRRGQAWRCQTVGDLHAALCVYGPQPCLSACETEKGTFTAMKKKLITALQVLATGPT